MAVPLQYNCKNTLQNYRKGLPEHFQDRTRVPGESSCKTEIVLDGQLEPLLPILCIEGIALSANVVKLIQKEATGSKAE